MHSTSPQFDFGQNWLEFSRSALTPARIEAAAKEFTRLHDGLQIKGRSFLEIGFGQGLSLIYAQQAGGLVVGCDINPKCAEALAVTREHFPDLNPARPPLVVGSILDPVVVKRLAAASPSGDGVYDIVHSWGVLHHTGDMATAIKHAASLVRPNGHLVIAIYNRHWSSLPWLWIKWLYVHSHRWIQKTLIGLLYPVIFVAKWAVTRRDPRAQQRGMDFYYNVVDWVGGYPYEYASIPEMTILLRKHGFKLQQAITTEVPTGCNEFIFSRSTN